jgi:DNA-binding transcriptional ArsR family regulator
VSTKNSTKTRGRDEVANANLVKALSHPLRWQILNALNEGVSTPAGIARRIGVRTENVSYHVRVLTELGIIELIGTTPVRGALEHHYRATQRAFFTDADAAQMPPEVLRDALQVVIRDTIEDLVRTGASEEVYSRSDVHITRTPLHLDEQGYNEVSDLFSGILDRVLEIQAESLTRMEGDTSSEIRTDAVLMHFPYVPPPASS